MAEVNGQEKTEQATSKKLQDTRNEGRVAKSAEINSLAIFTTGIFILYFVKGFIGNKLYELSVYVFSSLGKLDVTMSVLRLYIFKGSEFFILIMGPLFLGLVIVAFAAGYGQVGFRLTPKALIPKFSNINPITGLKNKFFSSQPFFELLKSVLKLIIIGWFSYIILSDMIKDSLRLVDNSIEEVVQFMLSNSIEFLWKVSLIYLVIAVTDYVFQKRKFMKNLMMTKQEVKEEHKQTEGDPQIKSQIKAKQFEVARNRMMQEVPKADVIITNPTHYAVALKYETGKFAAPKVVAKGVDLIAQKIKKIGKENDVHIHEDVFLARALYKACEIGDEIPENLYKAVAQIIAYVYQLKQEKKRKSII